MHASGYLKILYAILAIIYIISLPGDCHAYARNDRREIYGTSRSFGKLRMT